MDCIDCRGSNELINISNDLFTAYMCKGCLLKRWQTNDLFTLIKKPTLLKNGFSFCATCKQFKGLGEFVETKSYYECKQCMREHNNKRIACEICKKEVIYGHYSKHKKTHN